jgi:predicted enzyme related to lactoylglutathione lyase
MPRVVHFEIHADNPDRAAAFYTAVFSWRFQKWDGPAAYWLITTGEAGPGINGGMLRRPSPAPTPGESQCANCYICTVDVPSVDEYLGKATAAGGTVAMPKMAVPGVGWLAYAKDTEGNIFGMMAADQTAK